MSKMSKTIAILGVVAGLGVAALPLSTYATETVEWNQTDSDDTTKTNIGVDSDGNHYVSTDTEITLKIEKVLSIESDNQAVELKNSAASGIAGLYLGDGAVNLNVKSNNTKGYNLTIVGSATEGTANALTNESGDAIAAGTDLSASATASAWGYYVGETATDATAATWLAVPAATPTSIEKTTASSKEAGDDYTINFGARIVDGQAAGTYEGKVTFTATENPADAE